MNNVGFRKETWTNKKKIIYFDNCKQQQMHQLQFLASCLDLRHCITYIECMCAMWLYVNALVHWLTIHIFCIDYKISETEVHTMRGVDNSTSFTNCAQINFATYLIKHYSKVLSIPYSVQWSDCVELLFCILQPNCMIIIMRSCRRSEQKQS